MTLLPERPADVALPDGPTEQAMLQRRAALQIERECPRGESWRQHAGRRADYKHGFMVGAECLEIACVTWDVLLAEAAFGRQYVTLTENQLTLDGVG